jgi:prepilin-type N-terminal cleavage/methylation domain-containing protein
MTSFALFRRFSSGRSAGMRRPARLRGQARGFSMIEVLAALALAAVMIAGITTMVSASMRDARAQQAALYQTRLEAAAAQLVRQNYSMLLAGVSPTTPTLFGLAQLSPYLSGSTGPTNAYGQAPCLLVYGSNPAGALQALLVTEGGSAISDVDLGYISATSGQGGGAIPALNNAGGAANGAFGSWTVANPNPAGASCSGTKTGTGHLASLVTSSAAQSQNADYLYRVAVPGDPSVNAMQVPIIMATQTDFAACDMPRAVAADVLGNVLNCDGARWLPQASFHWRGPVADEAALGTLSQPSEGDVAITDATHRAYVYNNANAWQALAVDEQGYLYLGNTQTAGTPCAQGPASNVAADSTAVTTNAQGQVLSCQGGTWQTQGEIDSPANSTDSDCAIAVAQAGATDFPCNSAPTAAPVFNNAMGYWESVVRRNLPALPRNGMVSIYAWAHIQDAYVTTCPGPVEDLSNQQGAYETLYAMVVDEANPDTPLISAVTQSSKVIADLANINVNLTAPLPRLDSDGNTIQYQVVFETFWNLYGGIASPTAFTPSYCGTGNNIVPATGLVTSWTITPFY